jgi:hypothetical protein
MRAAWRAFVQEGDVLVCWGTFSLNALRRAELLSPPSLDARHIARVKENAAVGRVEEYAEHFEACGKGRAGRRLGALLAIADGWLGRTSGAD